MVAAQGRKGRFKMGRASDPLERKAERQYKASQRAAANLLTKLGGRLELLDRWVEDPPDGETYITRITFKMNWGYDGDVLAIVLATLDGEKKVGMHSDPTFAECVSGLASRLANGTMKWKEDVPYAERSVD